VQGGAIDGVDGRWRGRREVTLPPIVDGSDNGSDGSDGGRDGRAWWPALC
jgi:hypothetical protein